MAVGARLEWIHGRTVDELAPLAEGTDFTFGRDRSCSLVLEPGDADHGSHIKDLGISRIAGTIAFDDATVIVTNTSTSRPIEIRESTGLPSVVPVGGTRIVADLPVTLVITGAIHRHGIRIVRSEEAEHEATNRRTSEEGEVLDPSPSPCRPGASGSDSSQTQKFPLPTAGQRAALAAMFEGYLVDYPRWDPSPRTYEAAGVRLGLTETAVRRRIEEYRDKLKAADVAGLEVSDARPALAGFLLSVGIINVDDLDLLQRR